VLHATQERSMVKKLGKILIGNLSSDADEASIKELFEQAGTIVSVDLPVDQKNGKGRGYALVQMSNQQDTDQAILKLNGSEICGRRVTLNLSEVEEQKSKRRLFLFNF
jgi:RNA recognition motif-containing protein